MKDTPAFPLHNHGTQTLGMHVTGMTLRDYFSSKAMQSLILLDYVHDNSDSIADKAYTMADAMMKAREL